MRKGTGLEQEGPARDEQLVLGGPGAGMTGRVGLWKPGLTGLPVAQLLGILLASLSL